MARRDLLKLVRIFKCLNVSPFINAVTKLKLSTKATVGCEFEVA